MPTHISTWPVPLPANVTEQDHDNRYHLVVFSTIAGPLGAPWQKTYALFSDEYEALMQALAGFRLSGQVVDMWTAYYRLDYSPNSPWYTYATRRGPL